jgi:DnaJ-class molecular chaperone
MNPYLVLGIPRDADDQRIRQAYLQALKDATPESNPQRFQAVTNAYASIKDATSRHRYELINSDCPGNSPVDAFLNHIRLTPRPGPLSYESLKEYLRLCSTT